jgi:hypothetical protein
VEKTLLTNLAINQAFDVALRTTPSADTLVASYLEQIMFQSVAAVRRAALDKLEPQLVDSFQSDIQPAARSVARANAQRVLSKLSPNTVPDLADETLRRRILHDLNLRDDDRVKIVQTIVNDKANTLENRLTSYYLEPGATSREKVEQLRTLHREMETRRIDYERDVVKFHKGEIPSPPRTPQLDYASKFTADVKQGFREQARRTGTDAETATFIAAGHEILAWVTVNAQDACPDCRTRQGVRGKIEFWDRVGRPGSGKTICKQACFCMLVPAASLDQNVGLRQSGLRVPAKPVGTPADIDRLIRERRP